MYQRQLARVIAGSDGTDTPDHGTARIKIDDANEQAPTALMLTGDCLNDVGSYVPANSARSGLESAIYHPRNGLQARLEYPPDW